MTQRISCSVPVLDEPTSFPDLEPAADLSEPPPTRVERVFSPGLVLFAMILLAMVSLITILIAWSILYSHQKGRTTSISVVQVFDLIAAILSLLYIFCYTIAANTSNRTKPSQRRRSRRRIGCVVLARITLMAWGVALVITIAVMAAPKACVSRTRVCKLQAADVVTSSIGFTTIFIVLISIQTSKNLFRNSTISRSSKIQNSRVSPFNSLVNLLDRSIPVRTSAQPYVQKNSQNSSIRSYIASKSSTGEESQTPLPKRHSYHSDEASERPLTPLLPMVQRAGSSALGHDWMHLLREASHKSKNKNKKYLSRLDSGIYIISKSSSSSSGSTKSPMSKNSSKITSPSTTNNKSSRRPRAKLRSSERPDLLLGSDLKYCPSKSSPLHQWMAMNTAPIPRLPPVADIHCLYRIAPLDLIPAPSMFTRQSQDMPLEPPEQVPPCDLARKNTLELKVPGAFVDYQPSLEHEQNEDQQMSGIEAEYAVKRIPSKRSRSKCPTRRPVGGVERRHSVSDTDSRSQDHEQRPIQSTRFGPVTKQPNKESSTTKKPLEEDDLSPEGLFKRLTFGDGTFGFGSLFD